MVLENRVFEQGVLALYKTIRLGEQLEAKPRPMGSSPNHEINGQYGQKEVFSISPKSVIQHDGVPILYLGLTEFLFTIFTT